MVIGLLPTSWDHKLLVCFKILKQRNKYVHKVQKEPVECFTRSTSRVGKKRYELYTGFAGHVIPFQKGKWTRSLVIFDTKRGKTSYPRLSSLFRLSDYMAYKAKSLCKLLISCIAIGQLLFTEWKSSYVSFQIHESPKGWYSENW